MDMVEINIDVCSNEFIVVLDYILGREDLLFLRGKSIIDELLKTYTVLLVSLNALTS